MKWEQACFHKKNQENTKAVENLNKGKIVRKAMYTLIQLSM